MKKIVVLVVFLTSFLSSYGNNVALENLDIDIQLIETESEELINEKLNEETKILQEFHLNSNSPAWNGLFAVIKQILDCAEVQQDVASSFYGNPKFTQEQVNEMALGAFMGCMGWL
jgi:hypothetical protein